MNNEEQQTKQECRTLKKGAEHIKDKECSRVEVMR